MATDFQEKLFALGACDERRAAFAASAYVLPGRENGLVALAVNGGTLNIYDVLKNEPTDLLYSVELSKVTDLKVETRFPKVLFTGGLISFRYNGALFEFRNVGRLGREAGIIKQEAEKGGKLQ